MKNILYYILIGSSFLGYAQEITTQDALRYAVDNLNGTARFRAMSGAFGAVGGDLSAININPAGSVIFANNFASMSATNYNKYNKSNYFNTRTNETYGTLNINQAGAVLVFKANEGNDWDKIAIALNYENTNDFDNDIFLAGTNPNNSISQYFVNYANFDDGTIFNYYQYEMAFQTYVINPDNSNPGFFVSNVPSGGNYYQESYIQSTGYNGKITANFATSYKQKIFLGINLNAHFTDYVKTTSLYENNSNPENVITRPTVRNITFNNELYTYGSGFSLNLGAIFKATDDLRLGIAYESPTWYNLNDELTQDLYTNNNINVPSDDENRYSGSPIFIFPTYKLQTPSKWTGSAAYIINKKGLISVDISSKDYSGTKLKPSNDNAYRDINRFMNDNLQNTLEYRIGGEYKIQQFSLRAGYRFEESPYKVDYAMGDLTGYSGGIGYNFGESKLDLSYSNDHRNYNQSLISSGMNDTARMRQINNNVTVTYSINF